MPSKTYRFPSEPGEKQRISVIVHETSESASAAVAGEIAALIRGRAAAGQKAVLGLATGSTPQGVYDELVRLHRDQRLSFRNVVTFNLDEYWPMKPDALQSYRRFMDEYLFHQVDIDPANVHIPDGTIAAERVTEFCTEYERRIAAAGGIDLQLLGIGRTGHVGFNEPGSGRHSGTRLITLDKVTRGDAASDFFGERAVPRQALTMGVGTILAARRIVLMAFGEGKANIVRQAVEGPVSSAIAASFLQEHGHATFVLDGAAASELTPVKTPWLLGPLAPQGLRWDAALTKRAVIWLALKLSKPILKLLGEEYNEHGLQELLSARGSAYDLNIEVFKSLQNTITGWPGGKPGRPRPDGRPDEFPKRVVVFSPHPDDDVISMGGTLCRLCEHGHDVHVAYQTSGNIAVFDDDAVRHVDFVTEFCRSFELFRATADAADRFEELVQSFVQRKQPAAVDSPELQRIKALIRRTEARAAARFSGVQPENIHFLDLPFYETGRVRKKPLSDADVQIVQRLLDQVRPQQIYAAGDLSDPHGTHRVCLTIILSALRRCAELSTQHSALSTHSWLRDCTVWCYRGAWQEWAPHEIDLAVPLSPDEVERKRLAIFKHQSQKDEALFPGPWDEREFWQRAEDRNRNTAKLFDRLGLPEYEAIEAFARWTWRAEPRNG